jgi:hypothetical protein
MLQVLAKLSRDAESDAAFRAAQLAFEKFLARKRGTDYYAIRVAGVPVSALVVPREWLSKTQLPLEDFEFGSSADRTLLPWGATISKTILRGRQWTTGDAPGEQELMFELTQAGLVLVGMFTPAPPAGIGAEDAMWEHWVLGAFANAARFAHLLRVAAGSADTVYRFELEIRRIGKSPVPMRLVQSNRRVELPENPMVLPRYDLGAIAELSDMIGLAASDLSESAGVACEPSAFRIVGPRNVLNRLARGEP